MISRQTNGRHRYRTCMPIRICPCPYSIIRSSVCLWVCRCVCVCFCVLTQLAWVLLLVISHRGRCAFAMIWRVARGQHSIHKQRNKNKHSKWKTEQKIKNAGERKLWKYAWIKNKENSQIVLCGKLLSWLNRLSSWKRVLKASPVALRDSGRGGKGEVKGRTRMFVCRKGAEQNKRRTKTRMRLLAAEVATGDNC